MKCISFVPLRFFLLEKKGFRASRSGFRRNANGLSAKDTTTFRQTQNDFKPKTKRLSAKHEKPFLGRGKKLTTALRNAFE